MRPDHCLCLLLLCFSPALSLGHSLNDSYLNLEVTDSVLSGALQVPIADLEIAIGVDANQDGQVTWGEVLEQGSAIRDYVESRLQVIRETDGCPIQIGSFAMTQLAGGDYLFLPLTGICSGEGQDLHIVYSLLFDVDSSHRGVASVVSKIGVYGHIFSPDNRRLSLTAGSPVWFSAVASFFTEGVWHIWLGVDHVLFLLAMLFGVVFHSGRNDSESPSGVAVGREVLKLVTAFTVAHSITLILATLELVSLPSRWTESVIALSVLISGLNIIYPLFGRRHWHFAFAFGLVHGFGFASVLADLELENGLFVLSLLSFNLGVEAGQLVIVLLASPLVLTVNRHDHTRHLAMMLSSFAIMPIGVLWFLERGLPL